MFTIIFLISILIDKKYCLSLFLIVIIPITYKASKLVHNYLYDISNVYIAKNCAQQIEEMNVYQFDFFMRLLWKQISIPYDEYKNNKSSIILEYLYYQHELNCDRADSCSTCQTSLHHQINDAFLEGKFRQSFLKGYILQCYKIYLEANVFKKGKNDQNSLIYFGYINFLIYVEKSKVMSFAEMIRIKNKFNLSSRETAFQKQMFSEAVNSFEALNSRIHNVQSQQTQPNQEIKQTGNNHIDPEQQNYFIGILFDEEINQLEKKYFTALKIKEQILNQLCNDIISLQEIKKIGYVYISERDELKARFCSLAMINYQSQKLQFYMENYVTYLGFGESKNSIFNKKQLANQQHQIGQQRNRNKFKVDQSIFDKDNCVVFITLIDNIGTIRRVQNKFYNMFGYLEKETISKNINIIIPPLISKYHNQMLHNFIKKGTSGNNNRSKMNEQDQIGNNDEVKYDMTTSVRTKNDNLTQIQSVNLSKNNNIQLQHEDLTVKNYIPLILARNNQGWGVPIQLRYKTDYINLSDCGLTGHMKIVNKEYQYVMTNTKYFKIQLMTQLLFDKILSKHINLNDINNIYLNRVIPILHYFEMINNENNDEKENSSRTIKTVAFLPKKETNKDFNQQLSVKKINNYNLFSRMGISIVKKEINKLSIEDNDIYSVTIKFHKYTNQYTSFHIVEIQQIRKMVSPQMQRENLQLFKNQVKVLLDIDYNITKDLQILKKLEQITYITYQLTRNDVQDLDVSFFSNEDEENEVEQKSVSDQLQKSKDENYFINEQNTNKENSIQQQSKQGNVSPFLDTNRQIKQNENFTETFDQNDESKRMIESARKIPQFNQINDQFNQSIELHTQRIGAYDLSQDNSSSNLNRLQNNYLNFESLKDNQSTFIDTLRDDQFEGRLEQQVKSIEQSVSPNVSSYQLIKGQQNKPDIQRQYSSFAKQIKQNEEKQTKDNQASIFDLLKDKLNQLKQFGDKLKKQHQEQNASNGQILKGDFKKKATLTPLGKNYGQRKQMSSYLSLTHQFSSQFSSVNPNKSPHQQIDDSQNYLETFLQQYYDIPIKIRANEDFQNLNDEEKKLRRKTLFYMEPEREFENNAPTYGGALENSDMESNTLEREEKQIKEFEDRQKVLDTSSVKTGQTKNYEQKKNVRTILFKKQQDISLILLNIFGYLSILTIVTLTLFQYFNVYDLFDQAQTHIMNIPFPNSFRCYWSGTFIYQSLKLISKSNIFNNPLLLETAYLDELEDKSYKYFVKFINAVQQYTHAGTDQKDYFKFINTHKVPYIMNTDDKVQPKENVTQSVAKYKTTYNFTVQYVIQRFAATNYEYHLTEGLNPYDQKQQIDNFPTFMLNLTEAQSQVQVQSGDTLHTIVENVQELMIIVISVSLILIVTLFPLYYFVQYKNQQVLKLLASLTPLSLSSMLRQVQIALYVHAQNCLTNSQKTKFNNFKNDAIRKRKNISSTTELPKFRFLLLFICFFAFILIIIQPIVNFILIIQYNNEAQINIQLLGKLYNLRAQTASNLIVSYKIIQSKIIPNDVTYNPPYYMARIKVLSGGNPTVLNDVRDIIQQSQSQKKMQQNIYDNFFYKLLDGNICEALQKYPEFMTEENQIDTSNCATISQGILTQGFQISMKKFLSTFSDFNEIFKLTDNNQILVAFQKWEKSQNLKDFYNFSEFLIQVIILQKDFMIKVMNQDQEFIQQVQIILLIFQIAQLLIIFSIGWMKFYLYVSSEMFQIRKILTIVSIDSVIENPYFISFLTK